jgi:hypothetical protein
MAEDKPTIDERLDAVVQSLELMRLDMEAMQAEHKRLDARERHARGALLAGVAAYLRFLGEQNGNT